MRKSKMWSLGLALSLCVLYPAVSGDAAADQQAASQIQFEGLKKDCADFRLKQFTALSQMEQAYEIRQEEQRRKEQFLASRSIYNEDAVKNLHSYTGLSMDDCAFMVQESRRQQVPLSIVVGLIDVESSFNTHCRMESTGATGLGQIMANTGPLLARLAGVDWDPDRLEQPRYNILLTITDLDRLWAMYHDWDSVLTAYNRGEGGLRKHIRNTGTSTTEYSRKVQERADIAQTRTGV